MNLSRVFVVILAISVFFFFSCEEFACDKCPEIISVEPGDGAMEVSVDSQVVVEFSEPMNEASAEASFLCAPITGASVSGSFSWSVNTMSFTPDENFLYETEYQVSISTDAEDLNGNSLSETYSSRFTTSQVEDTVLPWVVSVEPEDSESNVDITSDITIQFSETMDEASAETAFACGPLTGAALSGDFSWAGNDMTFTPDTELSQDTVYSVSVSTAAMDLAGNSLADVFSSQFTTLESLAEPEIACSHNEIVFDVAFGGVSPSEDIEIWNSGDGDLQWLLTEAVSSQVLEFSATSGTSTGEHDEVTVSVDMDRISGKIHETLIRITDEDATNSPLEIDVVVNVLLAGLCVDEHSTADPATGENWDMAFTHPQDALDIAGSGDEIWIADGTYTPGTLDAVMTLVEGVEVYGGFQGIGEYETSISDRDTEIDADAEIELYTVHETILDGESSVYHVITGADEVGLNGLTVIGGNADGVSYQNYGGGMYSVDSDLLVEHCVFDSNFSDYYGGAIYGSGGSLDIRDCKFTHNTNGTLHGGAVFLVDSGNILQSNIEYSYMAYNSAAGSGGGVYAWDSSIRIYACNFEYNSSDRAGGAVYTTDSVTDIDSCNFEINEAVFRGGGLAIDETRILNDLGLPDSSVSSCEFNNNTANEGGGLAWQAAVRGRINLVDSDFNSNSAIQLSGGDGGGGALLWSGDGYDPADPEDNDMSIYVDGCSFSENDAFLAGGGARMYSSVGDIYVTKSTFSGNSSPANGGGLLLSSTGGEGWFFLSNNVFSSNSSDNHGGGLYASTGDNHIVLVNSLLTGNYATHGGGAYLGSGVGVEVLNNTFTFNTLEVTGVVAGGGGILITGSPTGEAVHNLYNNVFYGNEGKDGNSNDIRKDGTNTLILLNNWYVDDGYIGLSNITEIDNLVNLGDPGFVDGSAGNFRLDTDSSCIDAGTLSEAYGIDTDELVGDTDLDDTDRIKDSSIDMGAYEN